jgi:hypothetical protein
MMKILIGHDGSQSADAALVDLQRTGLPVEAEARCGRVISFFRRQSSLCHPFLR